MKQKEDIVLQLNEDWNGLHYWTVNQNESELAGNKDKFEFYVVSDDILASILGINSSANPSFSIIGIYVTIVYAVGKFVRIYFDKISTRIVYEELPNPRNLLQLCESIFLYRNFGKLDEEKELYMMLVKIYRSPESMMKITGDNIII